MSEEGSEFARRLFGSTTPEKQSRDQALFGPMHGIHIDPEPKRTATPNFDGGARADPNAPTGRTEAAPARPAGAGRMGVDGDRERSGACCFRSCGAE